MTNALALDGCFELVPMLLVTVMIAMMSTTSMTTWMMVSPKNQFDANTAEYEASDAGQREWVEYDVRPLYNFFGYFQPSRI